MRKQLGCLSISAVVAALALLLAVAMLAIFLASQVEITVPFVYQGF